MKPRPITKLELVHQGIDKFLAQKNTWIEIFHADSNFHIEGEVMEGYIADDLVLSTDKICVRYSQENRKVVDVEVYSNGRLCWYRCSLPQFSAIKYNLREVI